MESVNIGISSLEDFDWSGKTVLLRVDINCPVDQATKKLKNTNRINKSVPTFEYLMEKGAKLAVIAHQGDVQDYHNVIPMAEHARILSKLLGREIPYLDDVCGPTAQAAVKALKPGEAVLLGNLRYLAEEHTCFEFALKLPPDKFLDCWLVRSLAPLADAYVNDAFAAAHRNSPSLVTFQEILPSAAGFVFFNEITALSKVMEHPAQPSVFLLGGSRISDAFGMMGQVLANGSAHRILTCGVTGLVMHWAKGKRPGANAEKFVKDRGYDSFLPQAKDLLAKYGEKILLPADIAVARDGKRVELPVSALPLDEDLFDIGAETIKTYKQEIMKAGTVFVNGPPGVYENPCFEDGTKELFRAIEASPAYSVVGGGDSVTAAAKYTDLSKISHVCTAGGAMVQFLSGDELPLVKAMKKAHLKWK